MKYAIATSILIVLFLLNFLHTNAQKTNNSSVESLFDQIPNKPIVYYFTNPMRKAPSTGHLQGIQAWNADSNYIVITANSSNFSYFITAGISKKRGNGRLIFLTKLLPAPFRHAGGCQVSENKLFVGIEDNQKKNASKLVAYDLKTNIQHIISQRKGSYKRSTAGATAVIKTAEGAYFIIVGDWNSDNFDCYQYKPGASCDSTTTFHLSSGIKKCAYQSINLLQNTDGSLYMIGTGIDIRGNRADLFRIKMDGNSVEPVFVKTRYFKCVDGCSFRFGAGIENDKNGRLVLYVTQRKLKKVNSVLVFGEL